jgi:hypothetical protein
MQTFNATNDWSSFMRRLAGSFVAAALLFGSSAFAAQDQSTQAESTPPKHHSLAKGAAAGAVGGHFVGKGHAKAGAAAGALYQHHENKKDEKAAAKAQ